MNNWLKVLINANWKKILLVECLIGTEKRRENILNEYMTLVNSKSKKFWHTWHLVIIHEFSSV